MNAISWDHSIDLRDMLRAVEAQPSSRKNRLFCCACARRIPEFIRDEVLRNSVDVAELFAEREARKEQLKTARNQVRRLLEEVVPPPVRPLLGVLGTPRSSDPSSLWENLDLPLVLSRGSPVSSTVMTRQIAAALCDTSTSNSPQLAPVVWWSYCCLLATGGSHRHELLAHCNLIREIFGNPYRPVTCDPAWRTEAVVGIARLAYESREFGNLPVLADALQDAGCEHPDILAHLRGPGPHVRGCWVLDLVLGKA